MPIMSNWNGYEISDATARKKIEELENGKADATDGVVHIKNGGTGANSAAVALNNLGITWGIEEAPATGTPNTIYIQIN